MPEIQSGNGAASAVNNIDLTLEEIKIQGYSVLQGVISEAECAVIHDDLISRWAEQEREFGKPLLEKLGELGTHRGLLIADDRYIAMAANTKVLEVIEPIVGKTAILNLQTASAAFPHIQHFKAKYHRDFAKDFVATKPLAINAFWCIDNFTVESGATKVIPFSHAFPELPSNAYMERYGVSILAPAGSVIFWDSLLLHKTGYNTSNRPRFGINHMYTRPFLKQQVDFPVFLKGRVDVESRLGQLFGFWTIPPKSITEFRVEPSARTYRGGQG